MHQQSYASLRANWAQKRGGSVARVTKSAIAYVLAPVVYVSAMIVMLSIIVIPLAAIGLGFGALAGCAVLAFRWVIGV